MNCVKVIRSFFSLLMTFFQTMKNQVKPREVTGKSEGGEKLPKMGELS